MAVPKHISEKGIAFIKSWEGFGAESYKLPGEEHYTIGYGDYGPHVGKNEVITEKEADRRLRRKRIPEFEADVLKYVPRRWRRTPQLFDAFASIAFNLGPGVLTAKPPLTSLGVALRWPVVNRFSTNRVGRAFMLYVMPGSIFEKGLRRRREAEVHLLKTGEYRHNK